MKRATHIVVSTMSITAGLAGIEHGIGEILQGNTAPNNIMILSWPDSAFFEILAGEPAMTIIPSYLVSGILSIIVSIALMLWTVLTIHRKYSGVVLILLSGVLLLVGGGFGPPILGTILGIAATGIGVPLTRWSTHLPSYVRDLLVEMWSWSFALCLIVWVTLLLGLPLLDHVFKVSIPDSAVYGVALTAFGTLLLTLILAAVFDVRQVDDDAKQTPKQLAYS